MVHYYENRFIRRFKTTNNSMRITIVRTNAVLIEDILQPTVQPIASLCTYWSISASTQKLITKLCNY